MVACIIEYRVKPGMERKLQEVFGQLMPEIQAIDGFMSMDNFQSQTNPGLLVEISYWRDLDAMAAWMTNAEHVKAMPIGRNEIFSWYNIKTLSVDREKEWPRSSHGQQ
jgi:heme-degrading monooxygenase HmoA